MSTVPPEGDPPTGQSAPADPISADPSPADPREAPRPAYGPPGYPPGYGPPGYPPPGYPPPGYGGPGYGPAGYGPPGYPPPGYGPPPTGPWGVLPPQPANGMGVAAMTCGIVGTVLSVTVIFFWAAAVLGVLAFTFGLIGRGRVRRGSATNRKQATAGVVLGPIAFILGIGLFVAVLLPAAHSTRVICRTIGTQGTCTDNGTTY